MRCNVAGKKFKNRVHVSVSCFRERSLFMRGVAVVGGGGMGGNLKISGFFSDPPQISRTFFGSPPPPQVTKCIIYA